MYVKPGNYVTHYLDKGKTMLAEAWGGVRNLLGNVDHHLGQVQRISQVAAPFVAEMAGDRAGSVNQKIHAAQLQIQRGRGAVHQSQQMQNRIEQLAAQIY